MSIAHDNYIDALAKMGNTMGLATTNGPLDNEEPPEALVDNGPEVKPGESLQAEPSPQPQMQG